ncbi:F420-0--gamma-glutamyl ligase [Methanocalculus chunghsingensis]|uniref:F420-0--gamma-glutamyl ligase n=1 Tax=Methanocalculus chunghsingensis TaxID=156457 RepID=A0A8J7W8X9_9EURY|nr:coenzyme F420-0:L-glutamate ligase [Methanocalculus chunghsingensis]MBR1368317.1 F420-0--gamma-glutamyl ligase [Methanocalculus chunghsingensis]
MSVEVIGVEGLPIIQPGDNLAQLIAEKIRFKDGDILCVASSVYSKSVGNIRHLSTITPTEEAIRIAGNTHEDPAFVQAVLDASEEIIIDAPFILSLLRSGHIGVRAGVDHSNVEDGIIILLPEDPMAAASSLREEILADTGINVRVILTDTCGRAFRRGQTGHAIGWSGMTAIRDFRGDHDLFGHELLITEEAVVDEIAGFANFMMGESNKGVPAVIFRNMEVWKGHDMLYFKEKEDLIREALRECRENRLV